MLGARPAAAPALLLLFLLGAIPAATDAWAATAPPPEAIQDADTLVGTVRSVEEGAGLEIIIGFHLAVEVVYVRVGSDTRVEIDGQPAGLGDLQPGQVVRVRFQETADGMTAELVESVPVDGKGAGA